ncbi:MAG TPA: lytic transglycosylase [Porticoccus sp.]|nr:lytic transglycosylase [Porticoccus sp.]
MMRTTMDRCTGFKACNLQLSTLLLLALLFVAPNLSIADSLSLDEQRELYQEAKAALSKGDQSKYKSILSRIGNYSLRPYLEYTDLSGRLRRLPKRDVQNFLSKHDGTPIAVRLRYRWLETLRSKDHWQDYLRDYQSNTATTAQQCYYHLARIRHGDRSDAIIEGLKLWSVGKSQPKGCDKLFGWLIKNNQITESIAWQRYTSAVLNHQYQLARYLQRFFTSTRYQTLAKKFYSIDRNHRWVGDYAFFNKYTLKKNNKEVYEVITHGLRHLARVDATTALKHWSRYQQIHTFTPTQKNQIIAALVKGLYAQEHVTSADNYLTDNLEYVDVALLEWRTREAMRGANWHGVLQWIDHMPNELQQDNRWRYWKTRALQLNSTTTGKQPSTKDDTYEQLSVTRSFYGFLASEWLGYDYSMAHRKTAVSSEQIAQLEQLLGFIRTRELIYHDEYFFARREWRHATRNFNEAEWVTAAHLAQRWQWHNGAITSMIRASYWDDIDLRFPLAFKESFRRHSNKTGVPIHLLFAVARQESALAHDANSPAGAKGLMQLMPATAKQTARKNGVRYRGSHELHEPEMNITLGSRYYSEMLKRFDNNRILATAAYNAGPHRVNRWLKETESKLPFDAWIETIPFRETRNYVQNVLAFSVIYAHHLDNNERILSEKEQNQLL